MLQRAKANPRNTKKKERYRLTKLNTGRITRMQSEARRGVFQNENEESGSR